MEYNLSFTRQVYVQWVFVCVLDRVFLFPRLAWNTAVILLPQSPAYWGYNCQPLLPHFCCNLVSSGVLGLTLPSPAISTLTPCTLTLLKSVPFFPDFLCVLHLSTFLQTFKTYLPSFYHLNSASDMPTTTASKYQKPCFKELRQGCVCERIPGRPEVHETVLKRKIMKRKKGGVCQHTPVTSDLGE